MRSVTLAAAFVATALVAACGGGSDVVRPPPPLAYRPPRLDVFWPNFKATRLPNGLTAICNGDPGLPLVSVALGVRGGTAIDPVPRAGLSHVLARTLATARTRKLAPHDLAVAQDFIGSAIAHDADPDGLYLEALVLSDRVLPALSLLAEVATSSMFNSPDVEDAKAWVEVARQQAWSEPASAAQLVFDRAVFGAGHPLGQPEYGTAQTLAAITQADVAEAARQRLRPDGATVAVAGRVSCDEVIAAITRLYGGWTPVAHAPPLPTPPPVPPAADRTAIHFVPKPGLVQTYVEIGRVGMPRRETDGYVLRQLFGYVAGRASYRMRQIEHASYGMGARSWSSRDAGIVAVSGSVERDYAEKAISSVMLGAADLEQGDLPLNLYGVIAGEVESMYPIGGRAHEAARLAIEGLAPDYLKTLASETDGIRSMSFNLVARKNIRTKLMQIVLVGDPRATQAQVAQLDHLEFPKVVTVEPY